LFVEVKREGSITGTAIDLPQGRLDLLILKTYCKSVESCFSHQDFSTTPSPGPLPLCGMEKTPVAVHPYSSKPGEGPPFYWVWLRPRAALRQGRYLRRTRYVKRPGLSPSRAVAAQHSRE
jgi:hypothetical protein